MNEYDGSNIGRINWQPTKWELMLARPLKSWSADDWSYAVFLTDDCPKSRAQFMDFFRETYPELGDRFTYVLEVWEAGYGPQELKP